MKRCGAIRIDFFGFHNGRTYAVGLNWVCLFHSVWLSLAAVNKAKVSAEDFIDLLVATPVNATAMEAQRTNPVGSCEASHDAYTRLLHRLEPTNDALWLEVKA
jgi:hypothetical protein